MQFSFKILLLIFLLALLLRFLYFPDNIYFGFDQARDAFTSLEIINGHLKTVGPPTAINGLYHGVIYYYLFSFFYYLGHNNPEVISAFLRLINALGIFLIFLIGSFIFSKKAGLFAAFLYAVSFEQTQYSLFLNHPSLAVISVMLFYLGLSLLIFQKKPSGLIISALGLGLSIQFEFVLIYLIPIFLLLVFLYRKLFTHLDLKIYFLALTGLILTLITFIFAQFKYHFLNINLMLALLPKPISHSSSSNLSVYQNLYLVFSRNFNDNFFNNGQTYNPLIILFLLMVSGIIIFIPRFRSKLIFLLIWLLGGSLPYLNNNSPTPLYYYSAGASISLLIMMAFFLNKLLVKSVILILILLTIFSASNLNLITTFNPKGSIPTINVQTGMLLSNEKKAVDYIYQEAQNHPFAVNALTMPLAINTTWSYLFEWYGQEKYHYLPIWGGNNAAGYPGNLTVLNARSKLPEIRFTIIEPKRGIYQGLIDKFLEEEGFFTTITKEKSFGEITVQVRKPKI